MTLSRSNCDLYDLFMNQMSFAIVNNTICPDWYLNRGPLDLQSNTLPLCHGGCWHLVLITLVGLFNDSFAISQTVYLLCFVRHQGICQYITHFNFVDGVQDKHYAWFLNLGYTKVSKYSKYYVSKIKSKSISLIVYWFRCCIWITDLQLWQLFFCWVPSSMNTS